MARTHRRVKTGRLVARALDNTFTGTAHTIILIRSHAYLLPNLLGKNYSYQIATPHGPNGLPGDTGKLYR